MAAAGLYALDHHFERLAEDHQKASEIAQTLQKLDYIKKVEPADTNIVIFNLIDEMSKDQFMNDMSENHIQISDMGQGKLRMVTHLDYTARIQTVHKETNIKYYNLLKKFKEITGVPILVNTSFNVRGEPIVCSIEDAFNCFMGTGLDILVCENYILYKENQDKELLKDYKNKFDKD